MSAQQSSARSDTVGGVVDDLLPDRLTARVIEVGDVTAGIAVPERGGVRFYSSERSFDALDGTLFRSVEQAARVARERKQGGEAASRPGVTRLRAVS